MKHERDGRLRSARASAASFPPAEEVTPERQPSHADASHVARRRASSAPAHEVNLDEVELLDEDPMPSLPPPRPPPIASRPPALPVPSPMPAPAPDPSDLAVTVPGARAPFEVPTTVRPPPPLRRPMLIAGAVACSALVGGALAFFTRMDAPRPIAPTTTSALVAPEVTPAPVAATSTPTSTPTPTSAPGVPVVDVAALPRPHDGTVIGSPGHRLWIDGVLAQTWQATVACGPHTVQVGSAGAVRDVDVPCGSEVNVQP